MNAELVLVSLPLVTLYGALYWVVMVSPALVMVVLYVLIAVVVATPPPPAPTPAVVVVPAPAFALHWPS